MKIACVVLGTRGDVQPMVALATGLMKKGREVQVFAPPEGEDLVKRNNCPFTAFGPGIQKQVRDKPEKQKGGVAVTISPKEGKKLTMDQMSLLPELIKGSDLVLGPDTCDFRKINAESISAAISACVTNETFRKNAREISQRLQNTNGIELTVDLIEKEFSPAV